MIVRTLVVATLALASASVQAQEVATAVQVKSGAWIWSADGMRIGRVDDMENGTASVIYNARIVHIPVSTLSAGQKGLTSSLTRKEIERL